MSNGKDHYDDDDDDDDGRRTRYGSTRKGAVGGAKNLDPTCAMRDTVDFFQLDVMFFPHRAHIPGYLYLSICERSAR